MTDNCDIARDLMPLVIDHVASEGSQAYVENHVAGCEPCAQVFTDMKKNIPELEEKPELSFKTAMSQVRQTIEWKRLKTALLAVLFTLITLLVGFGVYRFLFVYTGIRTLPMDTYNVTVYKDSDHTAYVATSFLKNYAVNGSMLDFEDNDEIMYVYWQCAIIPVETDHLYMPNPQYGITLTVMADGSLTFDGQTVIREIRQGTKDNYITVYQQGDEIAPIDPAVEKYFQSEEAIEEALQLENDA
jgi:hypothetical protein